MYCTIENGFSLVYSFGAQTQGLHMLGKPSATQLRALPKVDIL